VPAFTHELNPENDAMNEALREAAFGGVTFSDRPALPEPEHPSPAPQRRARLRTYAIGAGLISRN
jgi:hypothetical protein